jgi:hypothetical protein
LRDEDRSDHQGSSPILGRDDRQVTTVHYGVGDIHGMRGLLDNLLGLIEVDASASNERATVVFLGDLVNRGPSSRQVLERLIAGPQRRGDRWITLRGNHDQLLLDAVAGKSEAPSANSCKRAEPRLWRPMAWAEKKPACPAPGVRSRPNT